MMSDKPQRSLSRSHNSWLAIAVVAWITLAQSLHGDIVLNEIMAKNASTLTDEDGDFSDWIELHNTGNEEVDIGGYHLTDDAEELDSWQFPAGTVLPADGYIIVFASDKNRDLAGGEQHTNFKLNNGGEYLALVDADGQTIVSEFEPNYPAIGEDVSFGREENSDILGRLFTATPGAANAAIPIAPVIHSFTAEPVVIAYGEDVQLTWEIHNEANIRITSGPSGLPQSGSILLQPTSSRTYRLTATNPAGTAEATVDIAVGPRLISASAKPREIVPGGSVIVRWEGDGERFVTIDDGFPSSRVHPGLYTPFNETLVAAGASWKHLADGSNQGTFWRQPAFEDDTWSEGPASIGYGQNQVTTVPENGVTTYFRREFQLADPDDLRGVRLRMMANGGGVAFLNGTEIARVRVPDDDDVPFDARAVLPYNLEPNANFEEFIVDRTLLKTGTNTIAIEVHSGGGGSMLFDAGLTAWSLSGPASITIPLVARNDAGEVSTELTITSNGIANPLPPPRLIVSEFLWDIDGAFFIAPFRFIEIYNPGPTPVDLSAGVQLFGDAVMNFGDDWDEFGIVEIPTLEPGRFALAVARLDNFHERWGIGLPVVGILSESTSGRANFQRMFGLLAPDGQVIEVVETDYGLEGAGFFQPWTRDNLSGPPDFPDNWKLGPDGGSPGEIHVPFLSLWTETPITGVQAGDLVTINWVSMRAQSVQLEPLPEIYPNGQGSAQIRILPGEGSREYRLVARGEFATVTHLIPVHVEPEILSFRATPQSVAPGQPITLSWDVFGGDNVTISPGGFFGPNQGEVTLLPGEETLFPAESVWHYFDLGSDLGTAWKEPGFDDAAWAVGSGIFGYGNDIEHTILPRGNAANYFRKSFEISDPADHSGLFVDLRIDDGAQVFLNGIEVLRHNMPEGAIDYQTVADGPSKTDGRVFERFVIDSSALVAGTNMIAVGAHNNSPMSDDFDFDLRLVGARRIDQNWVAYTLRSGRSEARMIVPLSGAPQSFAERASELGFAEISPDGDEDGDGLVNELELAVGRMIDVAEPGNPLEVVPIFGGRIGLKYFSDLTIEAAARLRIELSRDLITWKEAEGEIRPTKNTVTSNHDISEILWIAHIPPAASEGAVYYRLRVAE